VYPDSTNVEPGAWLPAPAASARWHHGAMEERPESEDDVEVEVTPEELVAADEAMLLDLGGAEQLADLIADQSLGGSRSSTTAAGRGPAEATPAPPAEEGETFPAT
jgi:hypothetical protein